MYCIIDNVINEYYRQGRRLDVIRRYIRMKYRINMEQSVLSKRVNELKVA